MKAFEHVDIDINITPEAPLNLDTDTLQTVTETLLEHEQVKIPNIELHIKTCTLDDMQHLNASTRKKDKPTNVLSFTYGQSSHNNTLFLGDIMLCPAVIAEEALAQGKSESQHSTHLLVHGLLHLLGYDHENAEDALKMEQREISILAKLGHPNPYEEYQG